MNAALRIATQGFLAPGPRPALTLAVRGLLAGAGSEPPPETETRRGGGNSHEDLQRKYQARARIKALKRAAENARKAKADAEADAARRQALEIAEREGFKTEALRRAHNAQMTLEGIRVLARQINSEIGITQAAVRKADADSRREREQAIKAAEQQAVFDRVIADELARRAAWLADNEEIAIALLLIA